MKNINSQQVVSNTNLMMSKVYKWIPISYIPSFSPSHHINIVKSFLLFCKSSASSSSFILFRKCSVIFRNASLLHLICSSSSLCTTSSSPLHPSEDCGQPPLRILWNVFSSFFTKVIIFLLSNYDTVKHKVNFHIMIITCFLNKDWSPLVYTANMICINKSFGVIYRSKYIFHEMRKKC